MYLLLFFSSFFLLKSSVQERQYAHNNALEKTWIPHNIYLTNFFMI